MRLVGKIAESEDRAGAGVLKIESGTELFDFEIQVGAFEFPDAVQPPAAHDHGFHVVGLGLCAGPEFLVEGGRESGELLGGLAVNDDGFGKQTVLQGIG